MFYMFEKDIKKSCRTWGVEVLIYWKFKFVSLWILMIENKILIQFYK